MSEATKTKGRPYRMKARAEAARRTGERILDAARARLEAASFDEVTLARVAKDAGVTVQTVIRRFGSKEGLLEALAEREAARITAEREPAASASRAPTDMADAVRALVAHYERDGALMLNLLRQEDRVPFVAELVRRGREEHEAWVARHCAPALGRARGAARRRRLDAAVAATDLYLWKLLRLDRGRSAREVEKTMRTLLAGLEQTSGGR
jgi:AcrR family transcriptional regulator